MSVSTTERLRLKIIDKLHHQPSDYPVAQVGVLYILFMLLFLLLCHVSWLGRFRLLVGVHLHGHLETPGIT